MDKFTQICEQVKRQVAPTTALRNAVLTKAEEIRRRLESQCNHGGLTAEVRVDGSLAKDTWLREKADVDIFMRVSPQLTKQQLKDVCLPIAKHALRPNRIIERYAEHPYVETNVPLGKQRSVRVNVVPCYNVEKGQWLSATDRSPYHTEYMVQHLTPNQRDEVRLLKSFLRGVGSYGADIKTGGFSGMLCETLVVSLGNFRRVVEEFAGWQTGRFIDLEHYYQDRRTEVQSIFQEPLIVIDPVDKGRNLGAAVREEQLWNFVAACRQLLRKPAMSLFHEPKIRPLSRTEFLRMLREQRSTLLCINVGRIPAVLDILWSQLYRTERALVTLLENNDFKVASSAAWSDERSLNVILLTLEEEELPLSKRHLGPPISRPAESSSFLTKHLTSTRTISGPWIEGDRWVVERKRDTTSALRLLSISLKSGGKEIGVASLLAENFKRRINILAGETIGRLVSENDDFAKITRTYLTGRPAWLE